MKKSKDGKPDKLGKDDYYERLAPLQLELNDLARWLQFTGKRLMVVIEGRDTAGKGGVIAAIADTLNPRQCRTVALAKPSEREQTQWYFQRYVPHLPAAGEIVLFDRSWYNRAGVERVMGFCTEDQTKAFLKQVPAFEEMLVDEGILLFKYWLTVDQAQQEERFAERLADPLKRWKLSPIDVKAREKYAEYGQARDVFYHPSHPYSIGLLNAVPRLDAEGDALLTIPGNPPNLLRLPKGCPFQPRCPHAMEICNSAPPLEEFAPGRLRACFQPVGDLL